MDSRVMMPLPTQIGYLNTKQTKHKRDVYRHGQLVVPVNFGSNGVDKTLTLFWIHQSYD